MLISNSISKLNLFLEIAKDPQKVVASLSLVKIDYRKSIWRLRRSLSDIIKRSSNHFNNMHDVAIMKHIESQTLMFKNIYTRKYAAPSNFTQRLLREIHIIMPSYRILSPLLLAFSSILARESVLYVPLNKTREIDISLSLSLLTRRVVV